MLKGNLAQKVSRRNRGGGGVEPHLLPYSPGVDRALPRGWVLGSPGPSGCSHLAGTMGPGQDGFPSLLVFSNFLKKNWLLIHLFLAVPCDIWDQFPDQRSNQHWKVDS